MEFVAKILSWNYITSLQNHFRGKQFLKLLKGGNAVEISSSEHPYFFDCQSQEDFAGKYHCILALFLTLLSLRFVTDRIRLDS